MAAGRVCTGFSCPYVALYSNTGGVTKYTNGMRLARGVSVNIEPNDAGENNDFYADNVLAETESNAFTGATTTLTVDGLKQEAEALIMGLPAAGTDGGRDYDDDQAVPYVGIGFVARFMSDGVTSYVPYMLYKNKFQMPGTSAATQEEQIEWQTQELIANTLRDDTAKHAWKYVGAEQTTEAAAETIIKDKFDMDT